MCPADTDAKVSKLALFTIFTSNLPLAGKLYKTVRLHLKKIVPNHNFRLNSLFLIINKYEMNIQTEKIELIKMLLDTENPKIIESIKNIFKKAKTADFWDDLSVEQRKEIETASLEIENGEITDYEFFIEKHR
ncbi:hypothetical protein [Mesonia phycicola]|nr:hypothetical protein [Mesonia phycicola]